MFLLSGVLRSVPKGDREGWRSVRCWGSSVEPHRLHLLLCVCLHDKGSVWMRQAHLLLSDGFPGEKKTVFTKITTFLSHSVNTLKAVKPWIALDGFRFCKTGTFHNYLITLVCTWWFQVCLNHYWYSPKYGPQNLNQKKYSFSLSCKIFWTAR